MIYQHIVVKNGKWYNSGEEVPDDENNIQNEEKTTNYTKTDIHRMPVEELRKLAEEQGIEGSEYLNGADIKKLLIEKMGL